MCNKTTLNKILKEVRRAYENVYGDKLVKVMLYGSYARGDYDNESDIDIVGIVDGEKYDINKDFDSIISRLSDIDLEYNIIVSPDVVSYNDFSKYKDVSGYYRNIEKQGIEIVA